MPAPFWLVLVAALVTQPSPRDPSVPWLAGPAWVPETTVHHELEVRTGRLAATISGEGFPSAGGWSEFFYRESLEIAVLSATEVRISPVEQTLHRRYGIDPEELQVLHEEGQLGGPLVQSRVVGSPCLGCRRNLVGRLGADGWEVMPVEGEDPGEVLVEPRWLDRVASLLAPDGYPDVPLHEGDRGLLGDAAIERWVGYFLTDLETSGSYEVRRVETRDAGQGAVVAVQALAVGYWDVPPFVPFRMELILAGETFRSVEYRLDLGLAVSGVVVFTEPYHPEAGLTVTARGEVTITLRTKVY